MYMVLVWADPGSSLASVGDSVDTTCSVLVFFLWRASRISQFSS